MQKRNLLRSKIPQSPGVKRPGQKGNMGLEKPGGAAAKRLTGPRTKSIPRRPY